MRKMERGLDRAPPPSALDGAPPPGGHDAEASARVAYASCDEDEDKDYSSPDEYATDNDIEELAAITNDDELMARI